MLRVLITLLVLVLVVREFSYVLRAVHQQELMEMDRILDLVHRFLSTPQVEVVEVVKELILQEQKLLRQLEQVVLVDLVVVLVVTLIVPVVVMLQLHFLVNLVMLEVIRQQVVAHLLAAVVVPVVPDKIIDQTIMQDMVVLV